MKSLLTLSITTTLAFTSLALARDGSDQLTAEEKDMVGHIYARVRHQEDVKKAREAHEAAVRHYHDVLRQAMIAKKPEIEPALAKIRINPGLLADAIWQRRNREFLYTLNFPLARLSKEERDQWNAGMKKLHASPTIDAFSKGLEANRQQQAQLRKEQGEAFSSFKKKARKQLLQIDGGLKPIIDKLETISPQKSAPDKSDLKMPDMPDLEMPEMPMPDLDGGC